MADVPPKIYNGKPALFAQNAAGDIKPLLVDADGALISSATLSGDVTASTEYTDAGTPPAHPVGGAVMWDEGGTWRTASTAKPLPVTASLSLSNYANETGGNLATIAGKDFATQTTLAAIKAKTDNIPALGQALAAASVPVILPSATITTLTPPTSVSTTDGTNIANVLKSDGTAAGQNAQLVAGTYLVNASASAGSLNADFMSLDMGNYRYVSLIIGSNAYSGTLSFQGSNDNFSTTTTVYLQRIDNNTGTMASNTTSNSISFQGYVPTRYFRVRMTSYTSGTAQGSYFASTYPAYNTGMIQQAQLNAETTKVIGTVNVNKIMGEDALVGNGASGNGCLRVTVASDSTGQIKLAAGTNLTGIVSSGLNTATIYDGTTALTPKFAKIAASSSGDNTLVAAVTSKKIRVLAYNFMSAGTVNAKFQSGAGGTDLTGLKYCIANVGLVAPFNPVGWFETGSNTLLNLNLSAAIAVGGELVYVEV